MKFPALVLETRLFMEEEALRLRPEEKQTWRSSAMQRRKMTRRHGCPHEPSIALAVSQPEDKKGRKEVTGRITPKAPRQRPQLEAQRPSRWPAFSALQPLVTPTALTSLLQSWKMLLVRILQEESTMVCFMMLLWQLAGDESSGTWGQGNRTQMAPNSEPRRTQGPPFRSLPPLRCTPPSAHHPHGAPGRTFLVSAHCGLTFQEFPKSTGSSSTWRLLPVKSLFWMPSKFPQRPHTCS